MAKIPMTDLWSQWLLHDRHADDAGFRQAVRAVIDRYVERLIAGAQLAAGQTLLDVGTGDGLVAFRAIERVGPTLKVWLTDISEPMLSHAEAEATRRAVRNQCT